METLDSVFRLLSRERRRFALYYLDRQEGPVRIDDLAAAIEEWEQGSTAPADVGEDFRDVLLTLEHDALPKLDAADFIEFDRGADQVRITGTSSAFSVILSVSEAIEQPDQDPDVTCLEELV